MGPSVKSVSCNYDSAKAKYYLPSIPHHHTNNITNKPRYWTIGALFSSGIPKKWYEVTNKDCGKFYHGHYKESITISSSWEGQDDVLEKFPAHKFPVERSGIEVAKNCTKSTAYFSTIIIREPVKNYFAHSITFILGKPSCKKSAVFFNIVQKAPLSFEQHVVNFLKSVFEH